MFNRILIAVLSLLPLVASAQLISGSWLTYPTYIDKVPQMVETPSGLLYYVSGSNLFSYDRNTKEVYGYTGSNKLSDNGVSKIFYNYDNHYLGIIYNNCNIDLLYDDGHVVNLSEIRDAMIMGQKEVHTLSFYKGRIYAGTSFGMVVFDDKKHCVVSSGNYGFHVTNIIVHDDHVILHIGSTTTGARAFRWAPVDANFMDYSQFTRFQWTENQDKYTIPEDNIIYCVGNNASSVPCLYTMKFNYGDLTYDKKELAQNVDVNSLSRNSLGGVTIVSKDGSKAYVCKDGAVLQTKTLNASGYQAMTSYCATDKFWSFDKNAGLGYVDYSSGSAQYVINPARPTACNSQKVGYITPSPDGERIYVYSCGVSHFKNIASANSAGTINTDGYYTYGYLNTIEDGELKYSTVAQVPFEQKCQTWINGLYGSTMLMAPAHLAEDPTDPNTYYWGTGSEGLYKFTNGEFVAQYNQKNSPMQIRAGSTQYWGGVMCPGTAVDRGGNVWIVSPIYPAPGVDIHILPHNKALLNDKVTKADWISFRADSRYNDITNSFSNLRDVFWRDCDFLVCKKSDVIMILLGYEESRLLVYDTKGTYDDFTDDTWTTWTSIDDQDGKTFKFERCTALVEDADGAVWISGNAKGVLKIPSPKQMANDGRYTAVRVKVPRNDGTDYADYLLDADFVLSMSVDPSNRKWFGTMNSGVYLVSADGSEVLEQFTAENSPLPGNQVNAIYADALSNRVYIGTNYGLSVYSSSAAPAADDYSDVYAYPNPVRPDYTGWITINGLMDNSYVKIGDAMGNIIHSGLSQGGMYMWDGCDNSGNRVKSGVYFVFASQKADSGNSGKVVTKIVMVN